MPSKELRRFYRTNDRLCFDYFATMPGERLSDALIRDKLISTDTLTYQVLLENFQEMETKIADTKLTINKIEPEINHYFAHINQKIELLAKALLPKHHIEPRLVNISLRGMAFTDYSPLAPDRELYIRLDLKPHNMPLILSAKVVYCHALKKQGLFKIAIKFSNITENKEQLLNQHLLLVQANPIEEEGNEFADFDDIEGDAQEDH